MCEESHTMTIESETPTPRLAYLVRCWLVETEQGPVWRAAVEDPHSGEQHTFSDLSSALAFLGEKAKAVLEQDARQKSIAEQQR
jgi:hypothetical protein